MRLGRGAAWVAILTGVGCQTIVEEMPTRSSPVLTVPAVIVVPVPIPAAPAPTPAPAPDPAPAPTPAPAPAPNAGPIDSVRVAFFGISCKNGKQAPNNGRRELPVGCTGYVTATPKDKNNVDVPARIHGPDIEWDLRWGQGRVEVRASVFPNDFNRDLVGLRVGEFSLCATVKGVQGCLNGTVTP